MPMNYIRTAAAIWVIASCSSSARAQGLIIPGAGPINRAGSDLSQMASTRGAR